MKNLFAILFCFAAFACGNAESKTRINGAANSSKGSVGILETLKTDYFDVTVNSVKVEDHVNTGDEFTNIPKEDGAKFLILDLSIKNTDSESRTMYDGDILVNFNGKDFKFDHAETILADGWGILLDQINPLMTKKTKVVYKIPAELKGPAFYNPGRADANQKIFLGEIK